MSNCIRSITTGYIESISEKLYSVIDYLYENPEPSFKEEKASDFLCEILNLEGFNIERNICGIKNSFLASFGNGKPRVAYICEYDAIEDQGHICGHNVNSAINLGAAIGLKHAVETIGGSVALLGCPAEEKYYSKIVMLENNIFKDMDAVICGHPMDKTCESGSSLAMKIIYFTFIGKEVHTSLNLKEGINALTPCIKMFNLIEGLNSTYSNSIFVNGIITDGGNDINVIPGKAECIVMVKALDKSLIDSVTENILNCAKFSAKLFNCDMEYISPEKDYLPLKTNDKLSKVVCHNLKEQGILNIHGPMPISASLDIGNISHVIPTALPYIGICENETAYYTKAFSECTIKNYAKEISIKAAGALALTGVDIIQKPDILE